MKRELRIATTELITFGLIADTILTPAIDLKNVNSGIVGALGEDTYTITVQEADTSGGAYTTAKDRYGDDIVFTLSGAAAEAFDLKAFSLKEFAKLLVNGTNGINLSIALGDKDYLPDTSAKTMA
jgi:hypothetical protein